jgi:hypothetical protein
LQEARRSAVDHRRALASELAEGNKPEIWGEIVKVQSLIETLERAIDDEQKLKE